VVERALTINRPDPSDGLDILTKVGGLEIGGICGAMLAAAAAGIPVIVDGFIATAGALIAAALARLGLTPLLDLEMRLGEGTGAVLAMNLVEASARIINEMATFVDAGVSEKTG
jgi:nicotinate-nucleotide--dimethylbenzimidazole phosphoribosyltransferase